MKNISFWLPILKDPLAFSGESCLGSGESGSTESRFSEPSALLTVLTTDKDETPVFGCLLAIALSIVYAS
jgi:hypothetical protein